MRVCVTICAVCPQEVDFWPYVFIANAGVRLLVDYLQENERENDRERDVVNRR